MKLIRDLYINNRFFFAIGALVVLFLLGYTYPLFFILGKIIFYVFLGLVLLDILILNLPDKPIHALRFISEKLSNGDENEVRIFIENRYPFKSHIRVIDEIPAEFQKRNLNFYITANPGENRIINYHLRPVKRGVYSFGRLNAFASSPLGLVSSRFRFEEPKDVPVYPSYLQLHKYEIMAISNRLSELGIKKVRRLGHNMEFEQIKEYVSGDDFRTINWKATARAGQLMINTYQDERSQQVYSLIDKGRAMRMPFEGMTLLDYAINASLVISNIAIKKDDKAGLITFHYKISSVLPAARQQHQMSRILETLYNQKTAFKETDFSRLYSTIKSRINQRSLLLLFTNFETLSGMQRQLPFLRKMAQSHVLVVIFFENTELKELLDSPAGSMRAIYQKAIAEKYMLEKKRIGKTLSSYGIYSILTTPENLTVDTINKYLEFKSRGNYLVSVTISF